MLKLHSTIVNRFNREERTMEATLDSNAIEAELAQVRETQLDRTQVNEIVRNFGELIGVEELELDETGVAELVVDNDVEVSLIHLATFAGVVAAIPMPEGAEKDGMLLRKFLQTNMSWALTQGGSFVFIPPRVVLCRLILLVNGNDKQLDQELAMFVELAKGWRDEITAYLESATDVPEGAKPEKLDEASEDETPGLRV